MSYSAGLRKSESRITRREMDLAASIQVVVEEVMLKLVSHVKQLTGSKNLVMAGGLALNCVANGRIWRESGLDRLFVQPAAGDAGGALGAALLVSHELLDTPRTSTSNGDSLKGSYLGPAFAPHEVAAFLDREAAPSHLVEDANERATLIADALAEGKVVGLLSGRMEFGPRAGCPLDSGRSASRGNAEHDEPEDQVSRKLPAVRTGGARREVGGIF